MSDLAKMRTREFQSMKFVKVRIVHIYITFHTQYSRLPSSYILYWLLREVEVVNLTILLFFFSWAYSNFHLNVNSFMAGLE